MISRFKEKPKTKLAWWAMGLGIAVLFVPLFLGIFAAVIRPMIDEVSSENTGAVIGFGAAICSIVLSLAALVVSISTFRRGERSWVMWVGFVPALLIGTFWIIMAAGELLIPH